MTATLILVSFAGVAFLFFVAWLRRGRVAMADETSLDKRLQPLDLEAFRNLIDESEEEFLRESLSPDEYRSVQRMRLRAAADYVAGVFHNAAVLLQFGQTARHSADPDIATAGRRLVDRAVEVRIYALVALCRLYVQIALPGAALGPSLADNYQRLNDGAAFLSRLQDPTKRALISSAI